MNAEFSNAHFEWSFCAIYHYFHNQNKFCWAGVLEKSGTFVQWGYQALHCVHALFVPVLQCHALNRHRPIDKKCNFFLAPEFINSVISQYSGDYRQWITTQNVHKKILHALHLKWTILNKYFSSYMCQTGSTTFFGWVYNEYKLRKLHSISSTEIKCNSATMGKFKNMTGFLRALFEVCTGAVCIVLMFYTISNCQNHGIFT